MSRAPVIWMYCEFLLAYDCRLVRCELRVSSFKGFPEAREREREEPEERLNTV